MVINRESLSTIKKSYNLILFNHRPLYGAQSQIQHKENNEIKTHIKPYDQYKLSDP